MRGAFEKAPLHPENFNKRDLPQTVYPNTQQKTMAKHHRFFVVLRRVARAQPPQATTATLTAISERTVWHPRADNHYFFHGA